MIDLKSIKTQLIIFLACFAIFLSLKDADPAFLLSTFIAVVSAAGTESLFGYLRNKKFSISESSLISGLIIGYVLSSGQAWWMFVLAPLLAIGSKHLIRINNKHLFNPAAFGIFFLIILFSAQTQWKGTYVWYILVPAGIYFISRIRKSEILIAYGLASLILFGIQAVMQKTNLLNIFGYLSYFYIFIMVIEPKTSPLRPAGKTVFGIGVAVFIFILTEAAVKLDGELSALLVLNLFVPLLNKIPQRRSL